MDDGAVVVLSGGADSCISLWWAKAYFKKVIAITYDYGQSHRVEIMAAHKIAQLAEVHHDIVEVRNVLRSTSPLTDKSQKLETYSDFNTMSDTIGDRVELTFVPLRNTLFLTIAANYAVYYGYNNLVTGVCQADGANYPDCTRRFVDSMQWTVNESLGLTQTPPQFHIHTPLMWISKAQSVIEALKYDGCYAALAYSHTAYSGEFPPVTQDHATVLRAHGFSEAGVPDPMMVRAYWLGLSSGLPKTDNYIKYEHALASLPVTDELDLYRKLYDLELLFPEHDMTTREDALQAIRTLIKYIGDDPDQPHLKRTPDRVLDAWDNDWGTGYRDYDFSVTLFDDEGPIHDQMIFMKDISFFSTCSHHLATFYGKAAIAYIPRGKIVGLSKLPRIVQHFASRLQVQERLVREIADFIAEKISPHCAVSLEATHMCMVSRGVKQPDAKTRTTALRGLFREDESAQSEFISQVRSR